jgi:predicted RNase H-like HicB family nuclease
MKYVYPVIITDSGKEPHRWVVFIPDFDAHTEGDDLADAIEMARDAIANLGICMKDMGNEIPEPSTPDMVSVRDGSLLTLVDVDFDEFRRKHERRTVKKTLSLPSWLNKAAEEKGLNFSSVLQQALKRELDL